MYESSMRVSELLELARNSTDIAPEVGDEYYLLWLNSLESLIYTGVVKECGVYECAVDGETLDISNVQTDTLEALPRGCDLRAVYIGGRELTRVDAGTFLRHPEKLCFYTVGPKVYLNCPYGIGGTAKVVYYRRPAPKTTESLSAFVSLPDEFLPMALDYLVGCAYALICEDNQAANRFAAYNSALEAFKEWQDKSKGGN